MEWFETIRSFFMVIFTACASYMLIQMQKDMKTQAEHIHHLYIMFYDKLSEYKVKNVVDVPQSETPRIAMPNNPDILKENEK